MGGEGTTMQMEQIRGSAREAGAATTDSQLRRLLDEGLVHLSLGREDDAVRVWREALERSPDNPRALDYLETLGVIPPRHARESGEVAALTPEQVVREPARPVLGGTAGPELMVVGESAGGELVVGLAEEDIVGLLARAREEMEDGNLGAALDRCEDVLRRVPAEPRATECAREVKDRLVNFYLEELKPLSQVPYLCANDANILELSLDPIGGFLLSQVDADITLEDLLTIMGTFDQYKVVSALHFFLRHGIVELRPAPAPTRRR